MGRIGIPGRSAGPGSDDWIAAEFERIKRWQREFSASLPTMVRRMVADLSDTVAELSATQTTLADTVTALGVAQDELAIALAGQVKPVAFEAYAPTFGVYTSGGGVSFDVSVVTPTGYDGVILIATLQSNAEVTLASGTARVSGVVDTTGGAYFFDGAPVFPSSGRATASTVVCASVTGLNGGDSLTTHVDIGVSGPSATVTSSYGQLRGMAIFYKT